MKEEKLLMKVHWPSITMSGLEYFLLYTPLGWGCKSRRLGFNEMKLYISSVLGSPYLSNLISSLYPKEIHLYP